MRELYWDRGFKHPKNEFFSRLCIPPDVSPFVRLDGRRFQAVSEMIGAEKSFDKKFEVSRCICKENWNLSIFTSKEGKALIQQVLQWVKADAEVGEVV